MGTTRKIVLTDKQTEYLMRHFKDTDNGYLAGELGISETSLHRLARRYGLTKTKAHCRQMQKEAAQAARASHLRHGTYPPKGYHIPGSELYRFKPGHKETAATRRKRAASMSATRKEQIRREKERIARGLPQLTRLHLKGEPVQKHKDRHYLKRRGYVLDEATCTAYWTPDTRRSPLLEARPRFYSFAALE